jgi:hypothetical protein
VVSAKVPANRIDVIFMRVPWRMRGLRGEICQMG